MVDELIKKLLMQDGNETCLLTMRGKENHNELIKQVMRIKYGVRWHEYDRECPCQPETIIKGLLKDCEFKSFLKKENVLEDVLLLLKFPHNKKATVLDYLTVMEE